jgi:hypothetical protein
VEKHGGAVRGIDGMIRRAADQAADLNDLGRIKADRKLIKDQQLRPVRIACASPTRAGNPC